MTAGDTYICPKTSKFHKSFSLDYGIDMTNFVKT